MVDKFSQLQYQKFLDKKKEKKKNTPVDDEIQQRAAQIEAETHKEAVRARQQLMQSSQKQKQTTAELHAQGEKLENIKTDAKQVNVNLKEGHKLSKEIKEAGKIFGWRIPLVSNVKSYFSKERKMDDELRRKRSRSSEKNEESSSSDEIHFAREEGIPGQDKTDEELMNIYMGLKGMKKEANNQSHILHKQGDDIAEIAKYNDNSEHYMEKTNEELKKL